MTSITTNINNVNVDVIVETKENISKLLYDSYIKNINKLDTIDKLNNIIKNKDDSILRIMHWNVRYFTNKNDGNEHPSMTEIVVCIHKHNPDILFMNEVTFGFNDYYNGMPDIVHELNKLTDNNDEKYVIAGICNVGPAWFSTIYCDLLLIKNKYNDGTYSSHIFNEPERVEKMVNGIQFLSTEDNETRCYVQKNIKIDNLDFTLIGTHLEAYKRDVREKQFNYIMNNAFDKKSLIIGDLNIIRTKGINKSNNLEWENMKKINNLEDDDDTSELELLKNKYKLKDIYDIVNGYSGFTTWTKVIVDYILFPADWPINLIDGFYIDFNTASDHLPLILDLKKNLINISELKTTTGGMEPKDTPFIDVNIVIIDSLEIKNNDTIYQLTINNKQEQDIICLLNIPFLLSLDIIQNFDNSNYTSLLSCISNENLITLIFIHDSFKQFIKRIVLKGTNLNNCDLQGRCFMNQKIYQYDNFYVVTFNVINIDIIIILTKQKEINVGKNNIEKLLTYSNSYVIFNGKNIIDKKLSEKNLFYKEITIDDEKKNITHLKLRVSNSFNKNLAPLVNDKLLKCYYNDPISEQMKYNKNVIDQNKIIDHKILVFKDKIKEFAEADPDIKNFMLMIRDRYFEEIEEVFFNINNVPKDFLSLDKKNDQLIDKINKYNQLIDKINKYKNQLDIEYDQEYGKNTRAIFEYLNGKQKYLFLKEFNKLPFEKKSTIKKICTNKLIENIQSKKKNIRDKLYNIQPLLSFDWFKETKINFPKYNFADPFLTGNFSTWFGSYGIYFTLKEDTFVYIRALKNKTNNSQEKEENKKCGIIYTFKTIKNFVDKNNNFYNIKDIALNIEEYDIEYDKHFDIINGESGVGKITDRLFVTPEKLITVANLLNCDYTTLEPFVYQNPIFLLESRELAADLTDIEEDLRTEEYVCLIFKNALLFIYDNARSINYNLYENGFLDTITNDEYNNAKEKYFLINENNGNKNVIIRANISYSDHKQYAYYPIFLKTTNLKPIWFDFDKVQLRNDGNENSTQCYKNKNLNYNDTEYDFYKINDGIVSKIYSKEMKDNEKTNVYYCSNITDHIRNILRKKTYV